MNYGNKSACEAFAVIHGGHMTDLDALQKSVNNALTGATLAKQHQDALDRVFDQERERQGKPVTTDPRPSAAAAAPRTEGSGTRSGARPSR